MEERPYEDQDDLMINKLRERKEKFARTGAGGEHGDEVKMDGKLGKTSDKLPTKNNQQSNAGALTAFDYSG